MTSSYRFNTTDFTVTQYHDDEKLLKAFAYVIPACCGGVIDSKPRNKASSPFNFNIQFPISAKFLRNVEGVTLNVSVHQSCVTSIAPPTGHRNSEKHNPIDMTFTACFPHIIHYSITCKVTGERAIRWHRNTSFLFLHFLTFSNSSMKSY